MRPRQDGRLIDGAGQRGLAPWVVVTGLDGAGKSMLVRRLADAGGAYRFRLPHHQFVRPALQRSGRGQAFGDVHTDRLLFAADARLTDYLIGEWRRQHRLLVSQRGWMDNYVFGAAQGIPYAATAALLGTSGLTRPAAIVHLVAEPSVAFERIRQDPNADKFETLAFMRRQHRETLRFYEAVRMGDPDLEPFHRIPSVLIDTTRMAQDAAARDAGRFLMRVGIPVALGPGERVGCPALRGAGKGIAAGHSTMAEVSS